MNVIFAFLPLHMQLFNRTFRYGEDFWQTLHYIIHACVACKRSILLTFLSWTMNQKLLFFVVSVAFQKVSNFKWMRRDILPSWKFNLEIVNFEVGKNQESFMETCRFKNIKLKASKKEKFWIKKLPKKISHNISHKIKRKLERHEPKEINFSNRD